MSEKDLKEKKGGNTLKVILIILLTLVLLCGGIFGGMFLASKNKQTASVEGAVVKGEEITSSLDEFVVNLSDEGGKKYLKVNVSVGYGPKNKKLEKELVEKKAIMRDTVISVVRNKKATDMTVKGTEDLKKEILDRLNPLFNNGKLTNVYFSDLLVQ